MRGREPKVSHYKRDEDYYNVSTESHKESSESSPSFDCLFEKTVQVTNIEQHVVWEEYGLRLHIPSDSLPVNCSPFELKIAVGMSGEFELPEDNGILVSAVYSFKHNLGDKELHRPITLAMQHCAVPSALENLSIIRASAGSKRFLVVPGGDFTTTSGYGEIKLLKFSNFAIMFLRRHLPRFFTPYEYCCQVYTTAITSTQFNFEVCIFRNLQVLSKVIEDQIKRRDSQYEPTGPPEEIKFQERVIRLEIPMGSYGDGWIMDSNTSEIDRNKVDCYTDRKVFIPCVVNVEWVGDRETGPTKFRYRIKCKGAAEGFNLITVKSPRSISKEPTFKSKLSPQDFIDFPKPELAILMEIVGVQVTANWRAVGCALGLENNQLEVIYQSYRGETALQDCIRSVFTKWCDGDTCEYSWKKLAEVLCSATVKKQGLLPDIHAKLMAKYK